MAEPDGTASNDKHHFVLDHTNRSFQCDQKESKKKNQQSNKQTKRTSTNRFTNQIRVHRMKQYTVKRIDGWHCVSKIIMTLTIQCRCCKKKRIENIKHSIRNRLIVVMFSVIIKHKYSLHRYLLICFLFGCCSSHCCPILNHFLLIFVHTER